MLNHSALALFYRDLLTALPMSCTDSLIAVEPLAVLAARGLALAFSSRLGAEGQAECIALLKKDTTLYRHFPFSLLRLLLQHDAMRLGGVKLRHASFDTLNESVANEESFLRSQVFVASPASSSASPGIGIGGRGRFGEESVRVVKGGSLALADVFVDNGFYYRHLGYGADVHSYADLDRIAALMFAHKPRAERRSLSRGDSVIVDDVDHFAAAFDAFTGGALAGLDWKNVVAAGGAVLACLTAGAPGAEDCDALRAWFAPRSALHPATEPHSTYASSEDVDLFLYGLSEEGAIAKLQHIVDVVSPSSANPPYFVRTESAITIVVTRAYSTPLEVLLGFDIDAACVCYDGTTVRALPRAWRALCLGANLVDARRTVPAAFRTARFERRLAKYASRGFGVLIPGGALQRQLVDPSLYDGPLCFRALFEESTGLRRLLLMERLSLTTTCGFCCRGFGGPCRLENQALDGRNMAAAMKHAAGNALLSENHYISPWPEGEYGTGRFDHFYPMCDYSDSFVPFGANVCRDSVERVLRRRERWAESSRRCEKRDALLRSMGLGILASRRPVAHAVSPFCHSRSLSGILPPLPGASRFDWSARGSHELRRAPLLATEQRALYPLPPPGWTDLVHVPPGTRRFRFTLTSAADAALAQAALHDLLIQRLPFLACVPTVLATRAPAAAPRYSWSMAPGPQSIAPLYRAGARLACGAPPPPPIAASASAASSATLENRLAGVRCRPLRASVDTKEYEVGGAGVLVCGMCYGLYCPQWTVGEPGRSAAACSPPCAALLAQRAAAELAAHPPPSGRVCVGCGASEAGRHSRFKVCGACRAVSFCNTECLQATWSTAHTKADCKRLRGPKSS